MSLFGVVVCYLDVEVLIRHMAPKGVLLKEKLLKNNHCGQCAGDIEEF